MEENRIQAINRMLIKTISENMDSILDMWADTIKRDIPSYKQRPIHELRNTTSEHLEGMLEVIENNNYDKLYHFVQKIAPLRMKHGFPISGVQDAFFVGKRILRDHVFKNLNLNSEEILYASQIIEHPFEKAMLVYSDIYEKLHVKEAASRSREQTKQEQESIFYNEIAREKEKLEGIIAAIGADLALIDRDFKIEWWYSNFSQEKGVRTDSVGKPCRNMSWHKGTLCVSCPTRRAFKTGNIEHGSIEIPLSNGFLRAFQIISTPIRDESGEIHKVLELVEDVTDHRNLERKIDEQQIFLSAIADDAADAIVGLTTDEKVISWNKGAEEIFGYSSGAVVDESFFDLFSSWSMNKNWDDIKSRLKAHGYVEKYETVCITKDNRKLLLDVTQSAIKDVNANIIGSSLVLRDVTDKKRQEEKALHTERMALIGQMAAKVAHEMRNPLSSISLNSELLEDELISYSEVDTTEGQALIRSIAVEVNRLAQLSEEYLGFSGQPIFRFKKENVSAIINDLIEFHKKELNRKKIIIVSKLSMNLPRLKIDQEQIRRAILNLLRNAAEAMPEGGKIILQTKSENNHICISVSDFGVGISSKDINHIFSPFFSTKSLGTGLGLSITKQIVEEHGGVIMCQSKPKKGTTFTILLPLNQGTKSYE